MRLSHTQFESLQKVIAYMRTVELQSGMEDWLFEVEDLEQILVQSNAAEAVVPADPREVASLKAEVEGLRSTQMILTNGLGPGITSWMRCALRLRAEIKRIDPANRTEAQIDWRLEPEPAGIQ